MGEILQDPVKVAMIILLIAMEVPAAIMLCVWWKRACKDAENTKEEAAIEQDET